MLEQAPADPGPASPALVGRIRAAINAAGGALPFDRYMAMALYEPDLGYYTQERQRVGRGGDFVTSVSVGRCFGLLLARHLAPKLEALAGTGPGDLFVVEPGAETGDLAVDLISELRSVLPTAVFERVSYIAVEPFESKRDVLAAGLSERGIERFDVVGGWGDFCGARGVVVANELLDAMPVKRLRLRGGRWQEIGVADGGGGFVEVLLPIADPQVRSEAATWPRDLADGFSMELNTGLGPWFREAAAAFDECQACLIDYGLERSGDFLDPGRAAGTLRCYHGHALIDDPLCAPGEIDLTAHVDFERATNAAAAAGFELVAVTDQHRFLVGAARGWLLEIEARGCAPDAETAKLLRQFQSLSHPSAMGMAFKVLEVAKLG